MIQVAFKNVGDDQAFQVIKQLAPEPLPVVGDFVDIGGALWLVIRRYLLYNPEALREVIIHVVPTGTINHE